MNTTFTVVRRLAALIACAFLLTAYPAHAQLSVLSQFSPGDGQLVSAGFDSDGNRIWIYANSAGTLRSYTPGGTFVSSITRFGLGEAADDVDIDFSRNSFLFGPASTSLPGGTLLFINGEDGFADIYAVNPTTGALIATLTTSFGASHVVGGAIHPTRDTFFLVQDRVPSDTTQRNRIAEINPITGAVLNTFLTTDASSTFTVNFGDLDIHPTTGNLLVVSSDETQILELTPAGAFVRLIDLPAGVSLLSGLGIDELTGDLWVSGTGGSIGAVPGGTVWRLGFPPAQVSEPASYALLLAGLGLLFLRRRAG
jgi:hypothetical protein